MTTTRDDDASRTRIGPAAVLTVAGAAAGVLWGIFGAHMSFGPALVVLGMGGTSLTLGALALYRMLEPFVRPEAEAPIGPQAPARRRELERDKQAVLKAIREVEHDYLMRKISEADWRELSQRYRARAMRIIRELDAGDDFRSLIEQELKARLAAEKET